MDTFAPANIQRHLIEQTKILLGRIEAASGRLSTATDARALLMLVAQVEDNVSALTGGIHCGTNPADLIRSIEADYLFSRPLDLRPEARVGIHRQMLKFTAAIRSIIDPPKDDEVPF